VLLQQHGVSRTTLREALRPLLHDGTLLSVRGKGIVVAKPAIRQAGDVLMSFSDVLRSQRLQPGISEVRVTVGRCTLEIGAALQLPPDAQVVRVERVRTGDGQPVNFSISYIPAGDVPGFTAELLTAFGSLYALLGTRYEIHIAKAQDEMFARRASEREAKLLGVRPGDPVLVMNRVCVLGSGRPIEYALSVIRSDIYRYVVRLTPPRPAAQ
jgi:GntR family transcriptional regulator